MNDDKKNISSSGYDVMFFGAVETHKRIVICQGKQG